jgi:hypothetical protein
MYLRGQSVRSGFPDSRRSPSSGWGQNADPRNYRSLTALPAKSRRWKADVALPKSNGQSRLIGRDVRQYGLPAKLVVMSRASERS